MQSISQDMKFASVVLHCSFEANGRNRNIKHSKILSVFVGNSRSIQTRFVYEFMSVIKV